MADYAKSSSPTVCVSSQWISLLRGLSLLPTSTRRRRRAAPDFGEDPRQLPGSPRGRGLQDPGVRGGPGAAHSHPVFQGLAREAPVLGPRDLAIRANIFSTGWIDLAATVGMREMALASSTSPTPPATGSQWLSERTTNQGFRCRGFGFHELEL